jgi:single-stranded DNA-specific DHH superfamily exonuclease
MVVLMAEKTHKRGELERLGEFLSQARKGFLLYHTDADGVCSAALFLRFFRGFEFTPRKGPGMSDDIIEAILEKKPDTLVFLDMPVDQEWKVLDVLLKKLPKLRIVIIDHHIYEKDMNSERVVHINPRFHKRDAYIPASCVVYRLLEGLGKEVRPHIWVSAMGTIGDYGWKECTDLIGEAREDFPYLLKGEPRKSKLGYGAETIAAASTLKGLKGISECLRVLLKADGFEDFESSGKLREWRREFDAEFNLVMEDFEKNKEVFESEDLIIYEIKSELNINSVVSTVAGERYPDRFVLIRKAQRGGWKISFRMQSGRFNVGKIVKRASEGIGVGGGHEKAGGAFIEDWDTFLERLMKELQKARS